MKKKLFKLLAVMLCLMLVLTACGKDEPEEDDDRRGGRRVVTDTPDEDKPTDAITDVPTVAVTDVPTADVVSENDINGSGKEGDTSLPTVAPTLDPTPEPTLDPTPEPTAEPTPEPVVSDGNDELDLTGITGDGKALSHEEVISLAKAFSEASTSNEKSYLYLDTAMSMAFGGESMDVVMNETLYINGKLMHLITYTDMMGTDTYIEAYAVGYDDGKIESYTTYDNGATWYKGNSGLTTLNAPIGNDYEQFANYFKNAYIVENASGYTVTGQLVVEEEGIKLQLNCEINLDLGGKVTSYKMYLEEPVKGEVDGADLTMTKYDIEFETDCPEIEIPAEALNAKEYDINDLSGLLDGLDY